MSYFNLINKISIKSKTYLLVLLSVLLALIVSFISSNGLDDIRVDLDSLISSTEIERYTNKLILEEQRYRLNANGSINNFTAANHAYENALNYVEKIYQILNKTDELKNSDFILGESRITRQTTNEYKKLYMRGVALLSELNIQAKILETEGENITLNIQQYVESKRTEINKKLSKKTIEKINNASNIWQFTYVTRLHEKKYRLSPDKLVFDAFRNDYKFMMSEWERLKKMSDQKFEFNRLDQFYTSSKKYKKAMLLWVNLNNQLVTEVLPTMKTLGNSVISSAIQSAKESIEHISNKRNNIALTLITVSVLTIVLGVLFGALIAKSISSPLEKLKKQALAISDGKYETQINIDSTDEIGKLAEAFNFMSSTISKEMMGRKQAEAAQRRSQKMDAVGQLTGGIAHDFNNLLGIILGNLELLNSYESHNKKVSSRIQAIEKAGLRAAKLTRQLLSFSRDEATQVSMININHLITELCEIIKRSLTPEIDVKYIFSEDLWLTEIDSGDFEDALINLCINARDSMTGHGTLTIETHNISLDEIYCSQIPGLNPGEYIELSVSDMGEGIAEDLKDRIFEPFFTTKDQGKGTGLGLAMVYAFVKRSNGYIKCNSKIGAGTSFHIYLPKKIGEETIDTKKQEHNTIMPLGKETVLVVDDEKALTELAKEILETQGYRVLTALDGNEAISLLDHNPSIDLLFSDIVMPNGMNGYELAEQATVKKHDIKILLTSGFNEISDTDKTQKHAKDILIRKPYTREELIKQIRTTLDKP